MSSEKNMQRLIKEFLSKVKEKLPEWMKEKKEHKEVIRESQLNRLLGKLSGH